MATLISKATGNFTAAGTWAPASAVAAAELDSETASTSTTTSFVYSSTFTLAASPVDGVAVKFGTRTASPTGTFTVVLANNTTPGTREGTVTVNVADIEAAAGQGWYLFAFSSITPNGTDVYKIGVKSSIGAELTCYRDITVGNWSRMVRLVSTGAPAANDKLIVIGELTGAGTGNSFVVTNDNSANTSFGPTVSGGPPQGMVIGKRGTLTYSLSTSPYLRMKGILQVFSGGTLNLGNSGARPASTFTQVLEFDCVAAVDSGLVVTGTGVLNCYGDNSRTVNKTFLAADVAASNLLPASNAFATPSAASQATSVVKAPNSDSVVAVGVTDTAASSAHFISSSAGSLASGTYTAAVWLARGSGTNNRFVRVQVANSSSATPTSGIFADVDLQLGTIPATGVFGTATYSASSITATGTGYLVTLTGIPVTTTSNVIVALLASSAAGTVTYLGDATQNFIHYGASLQSGSSVPNSKTLTTSSSTGWKSGDVIVLVPTNRNVYEFDPNTLASDASGTTLTCTLNQAWGHSGTAPTRAEVINLTRNVKIRAVSQLLAGYVSVGATAVVNIDNTEFYYLGSATINKRGIDVATTTGTCSITNSSTHDFVATSARGFNLTSASGTTTTTLVYSNNNSFNHAGIHVTICPSASSGTWTASGNVACYTFGSTTNGLLFWLNDVGGVFTNNTAISGTASTSGAIALTESAPLGTFTGNTSHSNTGYGLDVPGITESVIDGFYSWRNNGVGLNISTTNTPVALTISNSTFVGNVTSNLSIASGGNLSFVDCVIAGETSFATAAGLAFAAGATGNLADIVCDNCTFGVTSGTRTTHTGQDISLPTSGNYQTLWLKNFILASATEIANQANMLVGNFVRSQQHDQTVGNHRALYKYGTISSDTAIFETASPSVRMTPLSASGKLASDGTSVDGRGQHTVTLASGATTTVSIRVRKSVVGDGVAYNGNQPRLILKRNAAAGVMADTVLATASGAAGSWETLTGTTPAVASDCALGFVIDCDGTAGWVNYDTWTDTSSAGTHGTTYWSGGAPFSVGGASAGASGSAPALEL